MRAVISRRFAKRQQMQWTKRGTHLLLQTQTRTLDGTLRPLFERCIRGSPTTIETVPFKLSQREHPTLPDALQVGPEPFGPTRRTTTLGRDLHRMSAQTQAHYGIYPRSELPAPKSNKSLPPYSHIALKIIKNLII